MQPGDLVKVKSRAKSVNRKGLLRFDQLGIVTAHQPPEGNLLESVHVLWTDGSHEIDFPDWLEIVQKAP